MAGTTIGEVNINLRMNLAQFNKDVQSGTDAAGNATQEMSRTISKGSYEARGTLMLLGEEIGVHIPRHLQSMIASLPGVAPVLEAAFSSVAVLAIIEIIVKVIEKIDEYKKHLKEAKEAYEGLGKAGQEALHKQEEEILSLKANLDTLTGDNLGALREQLQLIDLQTFDNIRKQFADLSKEVDGALDKNKVSGFWNFFGAGDNQAITNAKKDLADLRATIDALSAKGDTQGIADAVQKQIDNLRSFSAPRENEQDFQTRHNAEEAELATLLQYQKTLANNKTIQADKRGIVNQQEQNRLEAEALAQQNTDISQMQEILKIRDDEQAKLKSSLQNELTAFDNKIAKVREYKASWEEAHGGIDAIANQEIEQLTQEKAVIQSLIDAQNKLLALGVVPGVQQKAPDLGGGQTAGFGGTSDQLKLAKIKTDATYAQQVAQEERDGAETVNEKYKEQVALLEELHRQGLLVGKDYEDAMAKATAAADKGNHAWAQFGSEVGANILAAAEMKESWGQALASILEDLLKVILQMEVMKALSSVGGGGTWGSIIGSLFHRATGGPTYADQSYIVGENGPELFTPGASGRITPNGEMGGGTSVTYNIDARGAQAGVSDEIRAALAQTENRAVARAVVTSREIQLRRSS